MEEILFKLLEQTPTIIALSLGIFVLWRDKKETKKETIAERKASRKELKDVKDVQAIELKELNTYIRERDLETLEALESVVTAVSSINQLINEKFN
tara:strand:- start:14350 stop:14637 length:288 start_codon:yes stop_codon:yes gene_type:complete